MLRSTQFEGDPCKKCGQAIRYKRSKQCVNCLFQRSQIYEKSPRRKMLRKAWLATTKGVAHENQRREFYRSADGKAYLKEYYQSERGRASLCVNSMKTHVKRSNVVGQYTTKDLLSLKESYGNRCLCCGRHESELEGPLEQDHVIPLSKGGSNWITNIQPLCEKCNDMGGKGTKCIDYRMVTQ